MNLLRDMTLINDDKINIEKDNERLNVAILDSQKEIEEY